MMKPGMIDRKIHCTGSFQNSTKKVFRSGLDGRNEVWTTRVCLSSVASSPILGIPINKIIEIAAAYSDNPMRIYRWKSGFQEFALERKTARRKVPTAPMTE